MEKTALSGTYLRPGKSATKDVRYDRGCSIGMCAGLLRRVKAAHRSSLHSCTSLVELGEQWKNNLEDPSGTAKLKAGLTLLA